MPRFADIVGRVAVLPRRFRLLAFDCGCGVSRLAIGQEGLLSCRLGRHGGGADNVETIQGHPQIVFIRGGATSAFPRRDSRTGDQICDRASAPAVLPGISVPSEAQGSVLRRLANIRALGAQVRAMPRYKSGTNRITQHQPT